MVHAYSHRMLPPYSGFVQIAETHRARAQSFDGSGWEIHYLPGNSNTGAQPKRGQGISVDRSYFRVGHLQNNLLKPYVLPACLDSADVADSISELTEFLADAQLPFPAADRYEYWLLDGNDESPLALLFSCCEEARMGTFPAHTEWTALPHSKMKIENTADELARKEPPVNHRFQRQVARRAGASPRATWFKREQGETAGFPCFLVREDWPDQDEHDLCQRYLLRKAPRLLMLQGLQPNDRERLEIAGKAHAIEVDQYYPLYPEVHDQRRMSAILVEARLRRGTPQQPAVQRQEKDSGPAPLSKDMRILE
jgi:hypothetical protein